jgi:hypothetical protein
MADSPPDGGGGAIFAAFIDEEYQRQFARRDRNDSKGQQLLTHTGAFLTLMIALGTLVVDKPAESIESGTAAWFLTTLVLAVATMAIGIHVSGNRIYHTVDPATLDQMATRAQWADSEDDALHHVAFVKRKAAEQNRVRNKTRARWAMTGQYLQIAVVITFLIGYVTLLHGLN